MIAPHTITLYPIVLGQSELSGISKLVSPNGTNYQAFVQIRTESRDIINDTAGVRTMAVIYVNGSCPAKPLDRITFDGKTYEVNAAMPQRSPTGVHHTKIMAVELDQTGL